MKNWQKSSFSPTGGCIEVKEEGGILHIRDDERPEQTISVTAKSLKYFIKGVKAGEFDHFTQ